MGRRRNGVTATCLTQSSKCRGSKQIPAERRGCVSGAVRRELVTFIRVGILFHTKFLHSSACNDSPLGVQLWKKGL